MDVAADAVTMTMVAAGFGLLFCCSSSTIIIAAANQSILMWKRVRSKRTLLVCFIHMLHKIRQTYERKHM